MTSQINSQKLNVGRYLLKFFEEEPSGFIETHQISQDLGINTKIIRRILNRDFFGVIEPGIVGKLKLANEEGLEHLRDTIEIFEGLANHSTERK